MRNILAALLLLAGAAPALAQSAQDVLDGKTTENVLAFGMNAQRQMYSPLKQINKGNVRRLTPIWATSTMSDSGELAQPAIYDGVMYVANGNWTFALDVATGAQIWRTPVNYDRATVSIPGAIYRGSPTLYQGKLFRTTLDAHLVALDMKTGKQIWKRPYADFREGYTGTGSPMIAGGVLISGTAGGEHATRGFLIGSDPDTGAELWRTYTVPAPGEPGSETWPKTPEATPDAWKTGGGPTWQMGTYDPELDLVYWGVGNPGPYDPKYRGDGDALYTNSVIAIRPKTGQIVWHYQYTPNDLFDFDGTNELVMAELRIGGQLRKVIMSSNKNGFFYVIDRTDGRLIAAHPMTRINWASHIDLNTGRPVLTDLAEQARKGEMVSVYPQRGTNATMFGYDPQRQIAFLNTWELPRVQAFAPYRFQRLGEPNTAVRRGQMPELKPTDVVGHHRAIDVVTGKVIWETPILGAANSASLLVTGGGLVFTGRPSGDFIALDENTGAELWRFKTSSSVNAPPITYTHKGVQYVTVASGMGSGGPRGQVGSTVPTGSSIWTFALTPR